MEGQTYELSARSPFINPVLFTEAVVMASMNAVVGQKGGHSQALFMSICDSPLDLITPTMPEDYGSGGGIGYGERSIRDISLHKVGNVPCADFFIC